MNSEPNQDEKRYVARLVHGESYWLKDQVFRLGEDRLISERDMLHLSEHAVLTVANPGWDEQYDAPEERTITRDMFAFRERGENEEIEDVDELTARRRSAAERETRRARVVAEVRSGARSKVRRRNEGHSRD